MLAHSHIGSDKHFQFVSAILHTLASPKVVSAETDKLILDFVKHAAVEECGMDDRELIALTCIRAQHVEDALAWTRSASAADGNGEQAGRGFERMLGALFGEADGRLNARALEEMLHLHLSPGEEAFLLDWAGERAAQSLAVDRLDVLYQWLVSRLVAQGRYRDATVIAEQGSRYLNPNSVAQRRLLTTSNELSNSLPPIAQALSKLAVSRPASGVSSIAPVTGHIALVPWLPQPRLHVPAPRSLLEARSNAAAIAQADQGGPALDARTQLPLSTAGSFRQFTVSGTDRTSRMQALQEMNLSESTMRNRGGRVSHPAVHHPVKDLRPHAKYNDKPTIPAFGLARPAMQGGFQPQKPLDFAGQLRQFRKLEEGQVIDTSTPRATARYVEASRGSTQRHHGGERSLPPGAFPMSISIGGSTTDGGSGSEHSDEGEQPMQPQRSVKSIDSSADTARKAQGQSRSEATDARAKSSRSRTTSMKDAQPPTPAKKGRKEARHADPTPRRSKRLGSVAPDEHQMMHSDEASHVENSMAGRQRFTRAAGARRRKP